MQSVFGDTIVKLFKDYAVYKAIEISTHFRILYVNYIIIKFQGLEEVE